MTVIQTQMTQKPMLRAEVGMRVRCANKALKNSHFLSRLSESRIYMRWTHRAESLRS